MMNLLPGDQLWDRYRVEHVAAGGCESAWLSTVNPPTLAQSGGGHGPSHPQRHLLVPLHESSRHPLATLLTAAGKLLHLKAPPQQAPAPKRSRRARGNKLVLIEDEHRSRHLSATENLPLLGCVEWIGNPGDGGAAIVAAPQSISLYDLVRKVGPLTPAQFLPVMLDLTRSLDALLTMMGAVAPRPMASDDLLRTIARLMNPNMLSLRAGDGRVMFNCGISVERTAVEFSHVPAWSAWSDFMAPELYTELRTSPTSLIFGAARVGAFLLGCARTDTVRAVRGSDALLAAVRILPALPDEAAWAEIAAWAAGKRDPSKEFESIALSAHLPADLSAMLNRCLSRRPSRRLPHPGKMLSWLKKMTESEWADIEHPCAGCGLNFNPVRSDAGVMVCPACGREASVAPGGSKGDADRGLTSLRPSKRGTTAIYKRSAGVSSQATAVIAPAGMTLIAAGSFLSGERKIPRTLRSFAIDTTPVTEADYKRFLTEINAQPRTDGPGSRAARFDNHPVTGVTWYEANEYAEHYQKRLPTVYEWEKSARGNDGRKFPFGNSFKSGCGRIRNGATQSSDRQTAAVGSFPNGASPFGVMDMAGNVLEWTSTARRAGERLFRAVKGACYLDGSPELTRCTSVQYIPPECSEAHLGFRCVKDVE
jgi:formylglycine-generating enzyme required for sulfatase activity